MGALLRLEDLSAHEPAKALHEALMRLQAVNRTLFTLYHVRQTEARSRRQRSRDTASLRALTSAIEKTGHALTKVERYVERYRERTP